MKIIDISQEFRNPTDFVYPPGNKPNFEEYFYNFVINNNVSLRRYYIPIFWQSYFLSKKSIASKINVDTLHENVKKIIKSLDSSKKYFTVCGFDFGVPIDILNLDITIFSQQHNFSNFKLSEIYKKYYPIPLNCKINNFLPDQLKSINFNNNKFLANFIGNFETSPLRKKIFNLIKGKEKYYIFDTSEYRDKLDNQAIHDTYFFYNFILNHSTFTLCPRGFSVTSYRICESLQKGSIPVYISDEFWFPFHDEINFNDYGLSIKIENIHKLPNILENMPQSEIDAKKEYGKIIYNKYYDFEACAKKIIDKVNKL